VRYPPEVLADLRAGSGVEYRGWLPNHRVPDAFAQARVVLHVPRRQYARLLYGTPTIRVFEALACGAPLISTPWVDSDGLFRVGEEYLVVDTPARLEAALEWLWRDESARRRLARSGEQRILAAHTCRHRAAQLQAIVAGLGGPAVRLPIRLPAPAPPPRPAPAGYLDDSSEVAAGD
jgi:spore maturation protein CgeB